MKSLVQIQYRAPILSFRLALYSGGTKASAPPTFWALERPNQPDCHSLNLLSGDQQGIFFWHEYC